MSKTMMIEAPVVSVTLLEDRAHVRRVGQVDLPSGTTRLELGGLAPVLADKTLSARFEGGARVLDTSVERRWVVRDAEKSDSAKALEDEGRTLERERAVVAGRVTRLHKEQKRLNDLAAIELSEIAEDASWNRADTDAWRTALHAVAADEDRLCASIVSESAALRDCEQRIHDHGQRSIAADNPTSTRRLCAMFDVEAEQAGPTTLIVEYIVPSACWRPHHRAELNADGTTVEFTTDASVWQNTGEDWNDVKLSFSTERPSLGSSPPPLSSDVLHAYKKGPEVAVESREEEVETAGLGGTRTVTMAEVPGIDDGGDPMTIDAKTRATIPSNGRPHRVPIGAFSTGAKTSLVLMAELAPAVITKSELVNTGSRPILPGPVDLIRESGLVGRTTVEFVAPAERFEMGWGPDSHLRVAREVRELEEEKRILSNWTKIPRVVEIHVSNLARVPKHIEVTERVIVSEIEKVKIKFHADQTSDRRTPDDDGFVKWSIDVPPSGRRTLRLAYLLERHADVVGV